MKRLFAIFSICMTLFGVQAVSALTLPPSPPLDRPIIDQTGTLTKSQLSSLATKLNTSRSDTGHQIGILMIPTLETENLESYSLSVARQWGVGQKQANNGVLLLIAKDDRKLRIEVGTGLEGTLPDARAGRIIRNVITPEFKNNNFYAGIDKGTSAIIDAIKGEPEPAEVAGSEMNFFEVLPIMLGVGFFLISWLAAILGRTKSWWTGGIIGGVIGALIVIGMGVTLVSIGALLFFAAIGLLFDFVVSNNYKKHARSGDTPAWWAGGGLLGGGSSGGFGGGSFGGGGASGSW